MNATRIVRSNTGTYHKSIEGSSTLFCNYGGYRRMPRFSAAQRGETEKAGEHMFCKKCFPNGKPDTARYFPEA